MYSFVPALSSTMVLPLTLLINMANINHVEDPEVTTVENSEMMMEEKHSVTDKFTFEDEETSVPKESMLGDPSDCFSKE